MEGRWVVLQHHGSTIKATNRGDAWRPSVRCDGMQPSCNLPCSPSLFSRKFSSSSPPLHYATMQRTPLFASLGAPDGAIRSSNGASSHIAGTVGTLSYRLPGKLTLSHLFHLLLSALHVAVYAICSATTDLRSTISSTPVLYWFFYRTLHVPGEHIASSRPPGKTTKSY